MRDAEKMLPTLKELQEKKYIFPNSDLLGMLDDLLEKRIIELSPSKHPEEVGRTNDPKYCRYHQVVIHLLEKCITLKERITQLAKDGTIILDLDEPAETNHTTIWCEHFQLAPSLIEELVTIQFESLESMVLLVMVPTTLIEAKPVPNILNEDDEGWTLRSKDLFNHPYSIEERGKAERRTLDALRGRKGLTLTGNMKFSLLFYWNKNLFSLSH